jgi:hypothetical protein
MVFFKKGIKLAKLLMSGNYVRKVYSFFMKNNSKSAGLVATIVTLVCVGSANALPLTFSGGTGNVDIGGGAQSGVNYLNFDSLAPGLTGSFSLPGSVSLAVGGNQAQTESSADNNASSSPWLSGNNNVNFESPSALPSGGVADNTTYVATGIIPGGSVTLSFAGAQNYLGLLWGSVDPGNVLKFYSGANGTGSLVATVSGADLGSADGTIVLGPTDINEGIDGTAYVNLFLDADFQSVVATSSTLTFEMDNVAYGTVPDGGLTIALLGGALVGLQMLRRKFLA